VNAIAEEIPEQAGERLEDAADVLAALLVVEEDEKRAARLENGTCILAVGRLSTIGRVDQELGSHQDARNEIARVVTENRLPRGLTRRWPLGAADGAPLAGIRAHEMNHRRNTSAVHPRHWVDRMAEVATRSGQGNGHVFAMRPP
jgi:hypothetical protein